MYDTFENPFNARYASREMLYLFSPDMKFKTWRRLWIALAEAEKELGLEITDEQISELIKHKDDINYEVAARKEKECRHDVMAHVHAYGEQCPKAKGIIHLGATSCYVGDNTDIIIMKKALTLISGKIATVIGRLADFAIKYKALTTLGFTHFQPAQPVTVGKRACLWIQDLLMDLDDIEHILSGLWLLGSKGTTGTQASFLELFEGDEKKVTKLDKLITEKMGFGKSFPISGQTYPRKLDSRVLNVLSSIAQSAGKFSCDLRLLQSMKEIEEPFEEKQVGSSAMAYKRNPMRSERISALARFVVVNALNPAITASNQWLERTLDDSANKRISISQSFLAIDAILNIYINISGGMIVYPKIIEKHLYEELPFMVTENILMEAVKKGGDRQELHEKIRMHSMAAASTVKNEGKPNDLIRRIAQDKSFGMTEEQLESLLNPSNFSGRSAKQVESFIKDYVEPALCKFEKYNQEIELNV